MQPPISPLPIAPESVPSAARSRPGPTGGALIALALGLACALAPQAQAERADRDKPVQVESDRMEYDDVKRVSTFIGRVVLTKGTILIRADRMVVREDADGFQFGRAEGKPASFRQKREALEEFVEGYGLVIDYDGKADTVVLTGEASMRRLERERTLDEVHGARITYQSGAEFYTVEGRAPGAAGSDRVRMVIQPRRTGAAEPTSPPAAPAATPGAGPRAPGSPASATPAAPPLPLRPSDSLGTAPAGR